MGEHPSYINLEALHELCEGNKNKENKYLNKFLEMMPISIQKLKFATKQEDRTAIMKELHFMSPQLVFYGIENFAVLINSVQANKDLSFEELKNQLDRSIITIEKALKEVSHIIEN